MSLRFYQTSETTFDSHYSVDGFTKIWYDSFFLSHEMKNPLQERIMNYIADLGIHYGIEVNKDTTFKEFVNKYDELMYTKQCNKSPNECLGYFAKLGDWRNIKIAIKKGAINWNWGTHDTVRGGHLSLVEFFIEKGTSNWNTGMRGAAHGGHSELVEFFIEKGVDDWNGGIYGAVQGVI